MDAISFLGILLGIACATGFVMSIKYLNLNRKYTMLALRVIDANRSDLLDGLEST